MSETKTVLEHDTYLFSEDGPRLFSAGEAHPGEGWYDDPAKVPSQAAGQALGREANLAATTSTAATLANEAERLTRELAAANAENSDLRASITSRDEDIRQLTEKLADVNTQLGAANLKIADQAEQIAKFDKDGDGKPGGSAPKSTK